MTKFLSIGEILDDKIAGGEKEENIYLLIYRSNLDYQLRKKNKFILKPHQTIPKYYLLNHENKLILHYSMGSGKTAAAIFIATYFLENEKRNNFLALYNNKNRNFNHKPVFVVGAWQTQNAFVQDLINPIFHFTSIEEIKSIKQKISSSFRELREEGELQMQKLIRNIAQKINFSGYQSFFNECFPDLDEKHFVQDAEVLIENYKNGRIDVNKNFLESIRNSIVIVDEMQKLYSSCGINSYGFAISSVIKKAKEYNIKFVFLTGTILNNTVSEIIDVMNILNEEKYEDKDIYLEEEIILNDIKTYRIKEEKKEDINNFFKRIFFYYDQSELEKKKEKEIEIKEINQQIKPLEFYNPTTKKSYQDPIKKLYTINGVKEFRYKNENDSLPDEIHVGNIVIEDDQIMVLYSIEVEGFQAEKYKKYITENISLENLNDDESISLRDGIFDKTDLSIYYNNGVYSGNGLKYPHIKQYSAIGAEMVRLALYNTLNKEKTIFYHDKINNFGLKQYIEILSQNGFIEYGTSPKNDTRCYKCGEEFKNHVNIKHDFIPMRYGVLHGQVHANQRKKLAQLFNTPNNLYGEYISVIFISSVAYSGVSFLNTNHLVILNKINNLSKWKQIYSRIIRTHSHDLLPEDKRWAKIYTMVISHEDERKRDGDYTREEKYYKLRNILNKKIDNCIQDIRKNSITDYFFKYPERLNEVINFNQERFVFEQDLIKEISFVLRRIKISQNRPWVLNKLLERIRDPNNQLSFINMSLIEKREILTTIINQNYLKLFFIDTDLKQNIYCIPQNDNKNNNQKYLLKFKYSDLNGISIGSKQTKKFLGELTNFLESIESSSEEEKPNYIVNVRNILSKLFDLVNGNFNELMSFQSFWESIYYIHDEYYADDLNKFTFNHSSKGRSYTKIAGFYYKNEVILKPKEVNLLENKFPKEIVSFEKFSLPKLIYTTKITNNSPYVYRILSSTVMEPIVWFLRVIILVPNDSEDGRKRNRGLSCISFDQKKLITYFPEIDPKHKRKVFCTLLIEKICDICVENKIIVQNPFNN